MSVVQTSVAAATAVVGYDLLNNTPYKSSSVPRRIVAVGLRGSAAALDTEISILVGRTEVARIFNDATGAPNRDAMFHVGENVPPNAEIIARVIDAPATNPINLAMDLQ